jgi:hypothetical protein
MAPACEPGGFPGLPPDVVETPIGAPDVEVVAELAFRRDPGGRRHGYAARLLESPIRPPPRPEGPASGRPVYRSRVTAVEACLDHRRAALRPPGTNLPVRVVIGLLARRRPQAVEAVASNPSPQVGMEKRIPGDLAHSATGARRPYPRDPSHNVERAFDIR